MGFKTFVAGDVVTAADVNDYLMEQAVISCTSATRPSSPNEGMTIYETDTDRTYQYTGSAWGLMLSQGAWIDFTPTLSSGWALGNSTYYARYMRSGRTIRFTAVITIGSTATKGTTMFAALPVTAADAAAAAAGCQAWFTDTGTATYLGIVTENDTSSLFIQVVTASGTYAGTANITATVPHSWATGDLIRYSGSYEAAAAS